MKWLRLAAVVTWAFEMTAVVKSLDTWRYDGTLGQPFLFGCPRPWQDDPTIYECTLINSHRVQTAWAVGVVCTATTIAVLLLSWLPRRVRRAD